MAITNINLQQEIEDWRDAVCGKEVRSANISAFKKIQGSVNDTIRDVNQAAEDVIEAAAGAQAAVNAAAETIAAALESAGSAADSVDLSKSWAVGNAGVREGENTDNSKYYSKQCEKSANEAKTAADKAELYADFVVPSFAVNFLSGCLEYSTTDDINFKINTETGQLNYDLTA